MSLYAPNKAGIGIVYEEMLRRYGIRKYPTYRFLDITGQARGSYRQHCALIIPP